MRRLTVFLLLGTLLFSAQSQAWADTIQGRVAAVNSSALDLVIYDAQGRPYPNTLHLKVDRSTRLGAISSVTALRKNDTVQADVRQESSGVWRADSVTRLVGMSSSRPQAVSPSASLMNALKSPTGQKVLRGSLTGAITGAVASGTSGGKAGKGALIGAGVGAVGGLLESLFGGGGQQPSQSQSTTGVYSQNDTKG